MTDIYGNAHNAANIQSGPNKTIPMKYAAELWQKLCQILTDFKNSFITGKRIKFPIKLI